MAAAGAAVRFRQERYTVMGLAELLGRLPAHLGLLRRLSAELRSGRYDLVILIDYPGFNLRLAEAAHRAGAKVLYYIAPKYWASGAGRVKRLAGAVHRLAVILPFEPEFFARHGLRAEFVGHPLLDRPAPPSHEAARSRLGLRPDQRVLALFPGSRPQEIRRLWPPFRDAARSLLAAGRCDAVVVAGLGEGTRYVDSDGLLVRWDESELVLAAADVALVKSGTATLEAALADVPMVVAYRMHPVTAALARRLLEVPWISLVNLIADAQLVDELLQSEVTGPKLTDAAAGLLEAGSPTAQRQRDAFRTIRERLGGPGAANRVSTIAAELLG